MEERLKGVSLNAFPPTEKKLSTSPGITVLCNKKISIHKKEKMSVTGAL